MSPIDPEEVSEEDINTKDLENWKRIQEKEEGDIAYYWEGRENEKGVDYIYVKKMAEEDQYYDNKYEVLGMYRGGSARSKGLLANRNAYPHKIQAKNRAVGFMFNHDYPE